MKEPRRYSLGRIYRPKGSAVWWIDYSRGKQRHRESSGSRTAQVARNLLKTRIGEVESGTLVGSKAKRVTFANLAEMVRQNYAIKSRRSKPPLARLQAYFGNDAKALDITADRVTAYVLKRLHEDGAAPQTVKLEVGVLRRGLRLAHRARRLPEPPYLESPRVNNARTGFFTDEDMARLLPHLPAYLRPFVETAYVTGWRRSELRNLRWAQVDWEEGVMRLERGTTKSDEPRSFPFVAHPRLAALLREQRVQTTECERALATIVPWVFHRQGRQVAWYYDSWNSACRKVGLPGRLVHDLRRAAVRNLVRAGVSEQVAMMLSGHKTRAIFDRYHIVSATDRVEAVRKLAALHEADACRTAHGPEEPGGGSGPRAAPKVRQRIGTDTVGGTA